MNDKGDVLVDSKISPGEFARIIEEFDTVKDDSDDDAFDTGKNDPDDDVMLDTLGLR